MASKKKSAKKKTSSKAAAPKKGPKPVKATAIASITDQNVIVVSPEKVSKSSE